MEGENVGKVIDYIPSSSTCYVDKVSLTNPIVDGKKYTYRVYSIGGASTVANRSIEVANDMNSTLSSYSATSVKAKIPAYKSKIFTLAETDVTASVVINDSNNKVIVVTVPQSYIYKTNLVFNPKGTENIGYNVSLTPSSYVYKGDKIFGSYNFPFTGSAFDIDITRTYFTDTVPYYEESDKITVSVSGSQICSKKATLNSTADEGKIILDWSDLDVEASYVLYRAEKSTAYNTILGDYKVIEIPTDTKRNVYNGSFYKEGIYVVEDTSVENGKYYTYELVTKIDDAYDHSSVDSVTPIAAVPVLSASALSATQGNGIQVDINWVGVKNVESY